MPDFRPFVLPGGDYGLVTKWPAGLTFWPETVIVSPRKQSVRGSPTEGDH